MAKATFTDSVTDIRTLTLNIARGNITKKDYEAYLKSLPDLKGQSGEIPAFEEPADAASESTEDLTFSVG